jgi:hypothetical protein
LVRGRPQGLQFPRFSESFNSRETGTLRINGRLANSTGGSITDPAILTLLIEDVSTVGGDAVLPFALGTQTNGNMFNAAASPTTTEVAGRSNFQPPSLSPPTFNLPPSASLPR